MIPDLPEALIAGRERLYIDWFLKRKAARPDCFTDEDIDEYLRVLMINGGLRAGTGYYRAAALSAAQNRELLQTGPLSMPIPRLAPIRGRLPIWPPRCAHLQKTYRAY